MPGQLDLFYASHVMEHVPDDALVMRNILAALRPGGEAWLVVPLWDKSSVDGPADLSGRERERRFGQWDHVRQYGLDFADRLRAGEPTAVQVLIDGSDSNTATIAQGYALAMVNGYVVRRGAGRIVAAAPIEVRSRIWYNPELKSVNFIVPGVIAIIMMIVGAVLTALSIVKEKERGTIEQILVSPIRPLEMIIGKIVPYVVIALLDLMIIIVAGYVLFAVPIKGSLLQLAIFSVLYLVCSLGVGVFVSTIADTMQTAMIAAIFMSLLPSVLLSGFVFPIENMPVAIQVVTYFFPGRYFVTAIRGIYLKRVGLEVLWPEAVFLMAFASGIVWLSASRFRDKLE